MNDLYEKLLKLWPILFIGPWVVLIVSFIAPPYTLILLPRYFQSRRQNLPRMTLNSITGLVALARVGLWAATESPARRSSSAVLAPR